jgi:YVTN family beta-propeller protein
MQTKFSSMCLGICALFILGCGTPASMPGQTLKQSAKFDLPGPGGKRFDYLTIDEDDNYLFSTHLAAGQTYVIDLATNKVIATIADTPGAEGVEYVPELKKFYTSNAHDNTIGVVDLKQMKEDFRVQHAVHTLAVDLKTHRVYTPEQQEDGKSVARMVVYEAVTNP